MMNNENYLEKIKNLYDTNIKTFGLDSKSVGWKSFDSQLLRFDLLTKAFQPFDHGLIINDLGCGYGAMFEYLNKSLSSNLVKYYGYDISENMLVKAKQYTHDNRAVFIKNSIVTEEADLTFVSGTFNVKYDHSENEWCDYIKNTLLQISNKSRVGFSFNLLSSYVDWKAPDLFYGDPLFFFDFCKKNLSKKVNIFHDYPLYEWTISVLK